MVSILLLSACSGRTGGPQDRPTVSNLTTRGDSKFAAGQYRKAVQLYRQAIKKTPAEPVPRFALGHALFALEEYDEAADSIQKGLELMPKWPKSGIDLQSFFPYPLEFQARLERLKEHVDKNPDDRKARFMLAYCKHFTGHKIEARQLFKTLLDADDRTNQASRLFLPPSELPVSK